MECEYSNFNPTAQVPASAIPRAAHRSAHDQVVLAACGLRLTVGGKRVNALVSKLTDPDDASDMPHHDRATAAEAYCRWLTACAKAEASPAAAAVSTSTSAVDPLFGLSCELAGAWRERTKDRNPDFRTAVPPVGGMAMSDISSASEGLSSRGEAGGDGRREWPHCTTISSISISFLSNSGVCVSGLGVRWS